MNPVRLTTVDNPAILLNDILYPIFFLLMRNLWLQDTSKFVIQKKDANEKRYISFSQSVNHVHICLLGVRKTFPYSSTGDDSSDVCCSTGLFPPMVL
ncbi:hypothetical protein TNCV_3600151 [Trichonephila clavipes]|nr:hypothetical protein TNCV_3600151 [Trichonephila clavipes]